MFAGHYATLTATRAPTVDPFDAHVLACLLASAEVEVARGEATITEATGLDVATLVALLDTWFPTAPRATFCLDTATAPVVEMEEELLREMLASHGVEVEFAPSDAGHHSSGARIPHTEASLSPRVKGAKDDAPASSPPLWGRSEGREGGEGLASRDTSHPGTAATPLPVPPPQGGRGPEGRGSSHHASPAQVPRSTEAAAPDDIATSFPPPSRGRDREGGLGLSACSDASLRAVLPALIARRAMRPDHLWQDLGLFDRGELNRLLARHFPALHAGNTANMRWKKYFYRKLCEAEGFALCTAPSCTVCADFASCFGAEDGESRMALTRRAVESGARGEAHGL